MGAPSKFKSYAICAVRRAASSKLVSYPCTKTKVCFPPDLSTLDDSSVQKCWSSCGDTPRRTTCFSGSSLNSNRQMEGLSNDPILWSCGMLTSHVPNDRFPPGLRSFPYAVVDSGCSVDFRSVACHI